MADPDVEQRFQKFIAGSQPERDLTPPARLRSAFAQLLARGQDQAVPIQAFWPSQAAALRQPPPPDPNMTRPRVMGDSMTTDLPMRKFTPSPGTWYAEAAGGGGSPDGNHLPPLREPEAPFGGKGDVVGPYPKPYALPKSKQKARR